jgi:raffinose/stachyose/melibiose transport system substrate-binding protein
MPRKMLMLIGLVLITALLISCGTATPAAEATTAPPAGETKAAEPTATVAKPVKIVWWHISTGETHKALFQAYADEYVAMHPNITIEIQVLENEAFKSKMTTVMQSGEPPDIFQSWGGGVMNEYAKAGLLRDITPELDANGGEWRNTFGAGALGVYAFKGLNYGVPWDMGMIGWWYNKALFANAGITAPPATWTEFNDDLDKLKAAGTVPIAVGMGDKWPGMHMWAYLVTRLGGKSNFENAYLRTGSFTDEPFVKAGEMLQALVAKNPFQDGFLGATYGDEATAMGNAKVAMELMGQWAPAVMKDNSVDKQGLGENLGWFPFPVVEGGAGGADDAVGGGNGFALGKNAPDEAVDFVKYMLSVDCQKRIGEIGVGIPVVAGSEVGLSDPLMIQLQAQLAKAQYFQLYYDQALPPATGSVVNDSVQGLFAGTLTPQQAAQAIEDSAKQELG